MAIKDLNGEMDRFLSESDSSYKPPPSNPTPTVGSGVRSSAGPDFADMDRFLKESAPQPTVGENLTDAGRLLLSGVEDINSAAGWGLEASGMAPQVGADMRRSAGGRQEVLRTHLTPQMQEAQQQPLFNPNYQEGTEGGSSFTNPDFDWRSIEANVLPSVPGSIAMSAVGAPLAAGLGVAGGGVGAALAGKTGAKIGQLVGSGIGAGASEGVFSAASNAGQWATQQEQTPIADFAAKNANNPNWIAALEAYNGDAEAAKAALIQQGANDIFKDTTVKTGLLSAVTGGGFTGQIGRKLAGQADDTLLQAVGKGFLSETAQEAPQSYFEAVTSNQATKDYIDPTQDVYKDAAEQGLIGGVAGGIMGAFGGGASVVVPAIRGPLTRALADNPGAVESRLLQEQTQREAAIAATTAENQDGSRIQPNDSNTGTNASGQPGQQPTVGPLVEGLNNLSQPTDTGGLNAGTTTNTGTTENTGLTNGNTGNGGTVSNAEQETGNLNVQTGQIGSENNQAAGEAGTDGVDPGNQFAELTDQDLQDSLDLLAFNRNQTGDAAQLQQIDSVASLYSNELARRTTNAPEEASTQEARSETLPEGREPQGPQSPVLEETEQDSIIQTGVENSGESSGLEIKPELDQALQPTLSSQEADTGTTPVVQNEQLSTNRLQQEGQDTRALPVDTSETSAENTLPLTQQEGLQNEETSQTPNENATSTGQETEGLLNEQTNSKIEAQTQAEAPRAPATGGIEAYQHLADKGFTPDEISEIAQQPADKVQGWARGRFGKERAIGVDFTPQPATPVQEPITGKPSTITGMQEPVTPIDDAAHQAATSPLNDLNQPTEAQKAAGNYKKGKVTLHGMNISIENPQGSERSGVSPEGKSWTRTLTNHYGYIRGTEGNDGDHVDTFIGPNPDSQTAFVINQNHVEGGKNTSKFDEHKVMLGFKTQEEAVKAYHDNYQKGWKGMHSVVPMSIDQLKQEINKGVLNKPVKQATQQATQQATRPAKYEHKDFKTFTAMAEIEVDGETHPAKEFIKKVQTKKSALQDFIKCVGGG